MCVAQPRSSVIFAKVSTVPVSPAPSWQECIGLTECLCDQPQVQEGLALASLSTGCSVLGGQGMYLVTREKRTARGDGAELSLE